jgi:two-component system invasion response regulator UvrY
MDSNNLNFLIIEDHQVVVYALKATIKEEFPLANLFVAETFGKGIEMLTSNVMDLVILDLDVEGGNSPKMISKIRYIQPAVKILINSGVYENDGPLYLSEGADGFFSKKDPFQEFILAVKTILSGNRYINSATQALITDSYFHKPDTSAYLQKVPVLSARELEIVSLLLAGKWTKEIADILDIKLSTVSTHKSRIFEKLRINSIVELYKKVEKSWPELLKEL